jgi:glycerol-3-phosphate O-acyltransferase
MLWGNWQPARLLGHATDSLFRRLEVDDDWLKAVQAAAARGPVVYVLRNVSALDYLALHHLTNRLDLPRIGFVNGLHPLLRAFARPGQGSASPERSLQRTIDDGHSAALFLKRSPRQLRSAPRGQREADTLLDALLALQSERPEREIVMVPQTFVWTQRPERRGFSLVDSVFGPADYPGELRTAAQFLLNFTGGKLRAGEPLSLREFLERPESTAQPEVRVNRLTYALVRKLERERRSIVGPAQKSPERVREEVLRNPKLQAVIAELAGPGRDGRLLLTTKARSILRRMQTLPDAEIQRSMALLVEGLMERVFRGVDVDAEGIERLREATRRGSVVLLPSHKSHIDYLVLSTLLRRHAIQLPAIAAGDNLSFFPAGPLLRRGGAFFIRRSFKNDRLYAAVIDAYVRRLLRDGWMIEFFLEGGRSRTGKLLGPKLGLLGMVVSAALELEGQAVSFMPVSIGYERLMEEGAFERELSGKQKQAEDASALFKIGGLLADRWGRVNIQFGQVLELAPVRQALGATGERATADQLRAISTRLAHQVMSEINRVTALTPGPLVALVLLSYGRRGVSFRDLHEHCQRLVALLLRRGARATASLLPAGSSQIRVRAIQDALALYVKSGLLCQHVPGEGLTEEAHKRATLHTDPDVIFTAPDAKRLRLDLAKNTVIHLLVDRALIAVAVQCPSEPASEPPLAEQGDSIPPPSLERPPSAEVGSSLDELRERVRSLSRLFKYEFQFRVGTSFDANFEDVLGDMVSSGELRFDAGRVSAGAGHDGLPGNAWLAFYAATLRNFLESYRIAARSLRLLVRGPMADRELSSRALRLGERMFLEGEIERSEAVCRPTIANALSALSDQGYLAREGKQLSLAPSFESEQAAKAIEARVAAFLPRRPDDPAWGAAASGRDDAPPSPAA